MIADKYKDYMYKLIDRVIRDIGPRESCSDAERKLAHFMADEWKPVCDRVDLEKYTCHPTAFLGFFPMLVGSFLLALVFYWFFPPAAAVFALFATSIFIFEFVRYKEYLDFLFPEREGENVLGTIKPRGEVRKRLIVCGHIDSAYEFNLWLFLKNAAIPVMIVGVLGILFTAGVCTAKTIAYFTGGADAHVYTVLGFVCMGFYPVAALFLFFHTYVPVPGAMDDMAGVSIAAGLGRYLADAKSNGEFFPENTEVVLYGASCEEGGLRGARAYVKKHLEELKAVKTHAVIFDGIYDEKFLSVITREICTGAKHDPYLIKMAQDIARDHKWPLITTNIPLGASDGTEFSRRGISCTTLLCQDTSKLVPNYHTRYDTIEHIRPESLAVSLQMAIDMLRRIDNDA